MNEKHMSKTQLKLINTAGPLFAEDGLKGTRIRSITEAAGVNVAGINYHFGGKEKLYKAVAQYVFDKIGYIHLGMYWNDLPESEHTKEGVYKAIRICLEESFTKLFKSNHPLWYFKIIQRLLMHHDKGVKDFDSEVYEIDLKAINKILQIMGKQRNQWDAEAWLAIWYGHTLSLSILMPNQIMVKGNSNILTEGYIDRILEYTYIAAISLLEPKSEAVFLK